MENIYLMIKENIKERGLIIKQMEKVYLFGLMEENMKENINKIKKKDLVYSNGQMVESLEDNGKMVNKMEKEKYILQMNKNGEKESGKMVKE